MPPAGRSRARPATHTSRRCIIRACRKQTLQELKADADLLTRTVSRLRTEKGFVFTQDLKPAKGDG